MVVDDEEDICELTKEFLEMTGELLVDTFINVRDAREALSQRRYDVIVSDYQMPDEDGISFLKSLREGEDRTPFILFTGKGREDIVIEALNNGADFYLQKGGSPKPQYMELKHKIRMTAERREKEEALRESENLFRLVIETLPIGLWLADKDGNLLMGNSAGQDIWAAHPKVGQGEYDIFKARRLPSMEPIGPEDWALGHAVNEGVVTEFEKLEIEAFDGKRKVIFNWASPVRNTNGDIIGAFVINQDITAEIRTREALEAIELKYSSLIQYSPFGVFVTDENGHCVEANDAACDITGYSMNELLSMSIRDLVPENVLSEYIESLEKVKTEGHASAVSTFKHKSGETRYWSFDGVKISPKFFMGFVRDETLNMRAQRDLWIKDMAMASAMSGIALTDPDGRLTYVNQRFLDIIGRTDASMVIGHRPSEYIDNAEVFIENFGSVLEGDMWSGDVNMLRPDGSVTAVTLSASRVLDEDGTLMAVMATMNDITERKKLETTVQRVNHKLNLLSNITRHDLNNQLTILKGHLELAVRTNESGSKAHMKKALEAGDRIDSIIGFTKSYENMGVNAPRWQRMVSVIRAAHEGPQALDLPLDMDIASSLEVLTDDMVTKVFYNLIDNSIKHGGPITRIRCWTEMNGDRMNVLFSDDGCGIPAEEKEMIFQRGYGKNTGLGLFLAREILALTDASIEEVGVSGKGTIFKIGFPRGTYRFDQGRP